MKTTIDAAGRVVIPREIRRVAGLSAGTELEVRIRDGLVELEPQPASVRLVRRGRFLVAVPEHDVPPLTVETVTETRRKLRERAD
jgi:AbrB family looped-hinge helix DNA binding protein